MRYLTSSLALAASLVCTVASAQHLPHQSPTQYPFRCPKAGLCLEPTESASVVGGVRHVDDEIRFHAFYRPAKEDSKASKDSKKDSSKQSKNSKDSKQSAKDDSDNEEASPYCVVISTIDGDILASNSDRAECDELNDSDPSIFGRKPTLNEDAKQDSKGDDATRRMVSHIATAEPQPDHFEAWTAVQALAQRWLDEQEGGDES